MKRGFEENVPRVRPRVRLGRALDETGVEAEVEGDRKKKKPTRRKRPKPEAIAARMKTEEPPAAGEPGAGGES